MDSKETECYDPVTAGSCKSKHYVTIQTATAELARQNEAKRAAASADDQDTAGQTSATHKVPVCVLRDQYFLSFIWKA